MGKARARRVAGEILWPPSAPFGEAPGAETRAWWVTVCALTVIPLTAVLHHVLVYPRECMLNPFGTEYSPAVVAAWLRHDPSLPAAIVVMLTVGRLGTGDRPWLRAAVAPVFVSCLPLSLWIWDIPFSGRFICGHFHNPSRLSPIWFRLVSSRHLYALALVVWSAGFAALMRRRQRPAGAGAEG